MSNVARDKAVKHYVSTRPDLERQLEFFTSLWDAQDEIAEGAAPYEPSGQEDGETALGQGRTLFSLSAPEIPLEPYREAVRRIAALMAERAGLPEPQTTALEEVDLGAAVSPGALEAMLSGVDVFVTEVAKAADDERLTEALLTFILTGAATPFLRAPAKTAVASVGKFDWLQWNSGVCPACGTPASSASINDEGELHGGRRWLSCPTCRTLWEYPRIRCARCGTRTQTDLEYLFDDEDPGHRLHLCKNCHGYLPVAVEKELKILVVPEVEEVVMVPLETVAADRGYSPLGDETGEMPN